MDIQNYVDKLNARYKSGITTEHSFRGDFQNLIESLFPEVMITNEPQRIACGAPDYIITKKNIPIGYIEAKDLNADLSSKTYLEQFNRYKQSLENLIITNYIDFQFFKNGELVIEISIASIVGGRLVGDKDKYEQFEELLKDFVLFVGQTIKSAQKLAVFMANKARLLSNVIEVALISDENNQANSTLKDQLKAFQEILIHDINAEGFADIYAQTIAYGMFAARLHDPSLNTFTRQEAAELIPKSNPFLRKLFGYIAGPDIDDRIKWIVEALADIFRATDIAEMLKSFGKKTGQTDPIIHFYETFLSEYDPKLRKARGVWYTPEPVVKFIVNAVDDILKTEFGLPEGLADISKTKIKVDIQGKKVEQEVHKVQILDPATGTGTFLAEVVKYIYSNKFSGQKGIWSNYVENHLLPRLNGFELLMASYAMAHLKLDLLLTETGFKPKKEQRFKIYLTDSLEEHHADTGTLFANWLSSEANEANHIKRDSPVMCVIGNPPYSGISSNNGKWISNLIEDYKYVDGDHFNERKHWLNDDYVKFIRYGQHFIEKNGSGILAYINPHGFLDNPTFRGMRWHLLKTFDKIFTLDLHGNSKKSETSPDGSSDVNVFDIMQGVSINLFIKTGKKKVNDLGKVFHFDIFGKREFKYEFLSNNRISNIDFKELKPEKPFLFFIPKSTIGAEEYEKGFKVDELFPLSVTGIVTMGDSFIIEKNRDILKDRLASFLNEDVSEDFLNKHYGLGKNYAEWILKNKANIKIDNSKLTKIAYRIFDDRYTYFDNKLIWRWRIDVMQHFLKGQNFGLDLCRQLVSGSYSHVFITDKIVDDSFVSNKSKERGYVFPLYLYPKNKSQQKIDENTSRTPNIDPIILAEIEAKLGVPFKSEKEIEGESFSPIDILDYIYAVLHSSNFRTTYKEFLKIDFPRIPFPTDSVIFWKLVKFGGQLREFHLFKAPTLESFITQYPIEGGNEVRKVLYKEGRVFINETQYFAGVPEVVWNFYIGGYQPAQKWLKDRKDQELSFEDICHYQKIIVALMETDRVMKNIDQVKFI